jgi:hypothetical protein
MKVTEYTTRFDDHSDYVEFKKSGSYKEPNVSLCVNQNEVHYNEPRIYLTLFFYGKKQSDGDNHMVFDLYADTSLINYIDVNGTVYSGSELEQFKERNANPGRLPGTYVFPSDGRNVMKVYFNDEKSIPNAFLSNWCSADNMLLPTTLTKLEGNGVIKDIGTVNGQEPFDLVIPKSVKYIGNEEYLQEHEEAVFFRCRFNSLKFSGPVKLGKSVFTTSYFTDDCVITFPSNVDMTDGYVYVSYNGGLGSFVVDCKEIGESCFMGNVKSVKFTNKDFNLLPKKTFRASESKLVEVVLYQDHVVKLEDDSVFERIWTSRPYTFYVYVPCNLVKDYMEDETWQTYKDRIKAIPETIECDTPKVVLTYNDSSTYEAPCDCTSYLTAEDINNGTEARNKIVNVAIGNDITDLRDNIFIDCTSLQEITIPNNVKNIGQYAFSGCTSLSSINIPNGVTKLGIGTFKGCSSLTEIDLPQSITEIGSSCFSGTSIESFTFPNNVQIVAARVLAGITTLKTVVVGSNVTRFAAGSFSACTSLSSVTINSVTVPTIVSTTFPKVDGAYTDFKVYVPSESLEAYKAADVWSDLADKIYPIT